MLPTRHPQSAACSSLVDAANWGVAMMCRGGDGEALVDGPRATG